MNHNAKVVSFCCYFWFTATTEFCKFDLPLGFLLFATPVGRGAHILS
jgi:hypothetical protein